MKIDLVVNLVSGGWSPDDPLSMGGSEEAVVGFAEALHRRGHDVTVWQNGSRVSIWNGILCHETTGLPSLKETDILIGFKTPSLFSRDIRASRKILWTADPTKIDVAPDFVVAISQWHRRELLDVNPGLSPDKVTVIPLGVRKDFASVAVPVQRGPRVIYASSFDRGLERLLDSWPNIKNLIPEAELHIYYGWELFDKVTQGVKGAAEFKEFMSKKIREAPGVHYHGRVPETELEEAFRQSAVWAYPCIGGERFCLTAVKAQALGAVPVVVPAMALEETVRYGRKVAMEWFEQALANALTNTEWQEAERRRMVADGGFGFTWDDAASRLSALFDAPTKVEVSGKIRILVVSSTVFPVPLKSYGGLEQIAYWCAEGFAKAGHAVALVAPGGSTPPDGVELIPVTEKEFEGNVFSRYSSRLDSFDVVVDHSWAKFSYLHKRDKNPRLKILGVCHAPIETMYVSPPPVPRPCLVGLSKDHARRISRHLKVNTRHAYNGIDLSFYRPRDDWKRDGRYLFMGRMSTIKGPHVAVDVAARSGVGLDLVGDDQFTQEKDYAAQLRAACRGEIKYWGGVPREKTVELYSTRKALLNTILWDAEPFGLVMVEAMACGMPVLTFDRGSPREIVVHGKTGFVVDSPEEMLEIIKSGALEKIDPEACRSRAEEFSKERMTERYLDLCAAAIRGEEW